GVMAAAASLPALDWHAGQNRTALVAQNAALQARLLDGFRALDLPLLSPEDPARRGGSLMVRLPDSHPAPAVLEALRAQGIYCDARSQTLRASPGAMTTADGVEQLLSALHRQLH
ncbi:MAG: aminotransferase, partial [Gemmobacter sp.]